MWGCIGRSRGTRRTSAGAACRGCALRSSPPSRQVMCSAAASAFRCSQPHPPTNSALAPRLVSSVNQSSSTGFLWLRRPFLLAGSARPWRQHGRWQAAISPRRFGLGTLPPCQLAQPTHTASAFLTCLLSATSPLSAPEPCRLAMFACRLPPALAGRTAALVTSGLCIGCCMLY